MTEADGSIIEAIWENNRINGSGTYTPKKGTKIKAVWHNDVMIPIG